MAPSTRYFGSMANLKRYVHLSIPQGTEVYKIDNVTESDAGVYACVVGTDVAHAHLVAHLEVREEAVPFAPLPGDGAKGLGIIAGTLSVLAFLLLVLTLYIFRRCRMERFKKQQAIRVSPVGFL